jgi:CubicO group peptidase (beta-lactamase class C family)
MKTILSFILIFLCLGLKGQIKEHASVDNLFSEWNKTDSPGGVVGIIINGALIYSKGYGMADLEHNITLGPESVFYLASVSKQFVTFCILLLEEEGKLNLDDKVQKYLPDFPEYGTPITIRHFIHHTSGVRDFLTLMDLKGINYLDQIRKEEAYDIIKRQKSLNFVPGEKYSYSNSCYFMLGMIVEKASGEPLSKYARENIFDPLGMKSTVYYDDNTGLIKNRVFSYSKKTDGEGFNNLIMRWDLIGGGGVYSNLADLFLWDQNFYNNKLGRGGQNIINKMQEDGILNNGKSCSYAFGLQNGSYKGLKTVSHSGAMAGYRTVITRFPDEKFTVIILSNRSDADPSSKGYQVAELFLKDRLDKSVKTDSLSTPVPVVSTKSENPAVTVDLKEYCGSYYSDELDITYTLETENEILVSKIGNRMRMTLTIQNKDQFVDKGTGALFKFDRKGKKIAGFNLEEGNITNLKFTRIK